LIAELPMLEQELAVDLKASKWTHRLKSKLSGLLISSKLKSGSHWLCCCWRSKPEFLLSIEEQEVSMK